MSFEKVSTRLRDYSELVVLPHLVFALTFALAAFLTASRDHFSWSRLALVTAAVFFARTCAMAYNRLVDADLDARNPRTNRRPIPSGRVSRLGAALLTVGCALLFVLTAYAINDLAFILSPVALLIVLAYSHAKRFIWLAHFILGLALAAAPVGAWIAVRGAWESPPLWMAGAVLCFVAGFDVLYASWDEAFDRREGLHSWITRFGLESGLTASRILHALFLGCLAGFGAHTGLAPAYYIGLAFLGALLFQRHRAIAQAFRVLGRDRFRVDPALFRWNGWIAVSVLLVTGLGLW